MHDIAYSWHQLLHGSWEDTDGDFVRAIEALSDKRLDEVSAQLRVATQLLSEGIERYPLAMATWAGLQPEAFGAGLLQLGADLLSDSLTREQKVAAEALKNWRKSSLGEELTSTTQMAHALAEYLDVEARRRVRVQVGSLEGLALLFDLVARCNDYGSGLEQVGHRRRLREHVGEHPDEWLTALPWLIQAAGGRDVVTVGTLWAQQAGMDPVPVLRSAVNTFAEPVTTRALGLLDLLEGKDGTDVLLARIAARMDRGRPSFPRPLAEPASTWLADLGLEHDLRSAIERASAEFADEFQTQGPAEEEGHVGSLLARIESELKVAAAVRAVDGGSGVPAELTGSVRRLAKSEEANVHADVALTVEIDVFGQLSTTFSELVQVKKAQQLNIDDGTDSWRIKIDQLTQLTANSAGSVYWLIRADGSVLVVPAKLLLAIARGRRVDSQGTFTLYYSEARHAAVSLPSHLVDLTVGAWLGSDDLEAVKRGEGATNTTRARALFRLRIQTIQG